MVGVFQIINLHQSALCCTYIVPFWKHHNRKAGAASSGENNNFLWLVPQPPPPPIQPRRQTVFWVDTHFRRIIMFIEEQNNLFFIWYISKKCFHYFQQQQKTKKFRQQCQEHSSSVSNPDPYVKYGSGSWRLKKDLDLKTRCTVKFSHANNKKRRIISQRKNCFQKQLFYLKRNFFVMRKINLTSGSGFVFRFWPRSVKH